MAVSFYCKCEERKKPLPERKWLVIAYKYHRSAFSGYRETMSNYSTIRCCSCNAIGRTKASYVDKLISLGKYDKKTCFR